MDYSLKAKLMLNYWVNNNLECEIDQKSIYSLEIKERQSRDSCPSFLLSNQFGIK